jgi:hypothetical protein
MPASTRSPCLPPALVDHLPARSTGCASAHASPILVFICDPHHSHPRHKQLQHSHPFHKTGRVRPFRGVSHRLMRESPQGCSGRRKNDCISPERGDGKHQHANGERHTARPEQAVRAGQKGATWVAHTPQHVPFSPCSGRACKVGATTTATARTGGASVRATRCRSPVNACPSACCPTGPPRDTSNARPARTGRATPARGRHPSRHPSRHLSRPRRRSPRLSTKRHSRPHQSSFTSRHHPYGFPRL